MMGLQAATEVPIERRGVAEGRLAVQWAGLQAEHRRVAGDSIERPDVLGWIQVGGRDLLRAQQFQHVWIHQRVSLSPIVEQVDHILAGEKPAVVQFGPVPEVNPGHVGDTAAVEMAWSSALVKLPMPEANPEPEY